MSDKNKVIKIVSDIVNNVILYKSNQFYLLPEKFLKFYDGEEYPLAEGRRLIYNFIIKNSEIFEYYGIEVISRSDGKVLLYNNKEVIV